MLNIQESAWAATVGMDKKVAVASNERRNQGDAGCWLSGLVPKVKPS